MNRSSFFGKWAIIAIIFAVVGIVFINQFYFIVEPGERGLIQTFWELDGTVYDPWLNLKRPFIQSSIIMNVQTQKLEESAASASKDLQQVTSVIALNYAYSAQSIDTLYAQVGTEDVIRDRIIIPAIQESVKSSTALFRAEELITKRQEVSQSMLVILKGKLDPQGIEVVAVNIVNFDFNEDFDKAIEEKVRAEQEALTEKNRLEKIKYQADQQIATAEWAARAKVLEAEAEAESIRLQTQAIREAWWLEYVQLQWINQRDWVLPTTSVGENTPLILDLGQPE